MACDNLFNIKLVSAMNLNAEDTLKLGLRSILIVDRNNTFDNCSLLSGNILLRMMSGEFGDVSALGLL
jgi:hypothetical protein